MKTWYFNNTGWFDPMSEGALDSFAALQHTDRAFVTVEPRCHGGIKGLPGDVRWFPHRKRPPEVIKPPSTLELLKGVEPEEGLRSTLTYFMMGDVMDETAPGNHYMTTHEWPVPSEKLTFYLHEDGSLNQTAPAGEGGTRSYKYDPRNPAPTLGGHHDWVHASGPFDQSPLRERTDVLHFVSEPLKDPLAITGKIRMNLFFSTDVEDTAFIIKLVDIYPNGHEFILRESAAMGRYHSSYVEPSPLEEGQVYELDLDLWSTANVFNTGHRIGVIITSSSEVSYQVHPNTYEPVMGYKDSPIALNTIHSSPEHATRIVIPKVPVP
jgi:putative CocE/NonD family hydrolase